MLTPREKTPLARQPQDGSNSRYCITEDRKLCTLCTELFQTLDLVQVSAAPVLYRLVVTLLKAQHINATELYAIHFVW